MTEKKKVDLTLRRKKKEKLIASKQIKMWKNKKKEKEKCGMDNKRK